MNQTEIEFEKDLNPKLYEELLKYLPSSVTKVQHFFVLPQKSSRGLQHGPKSKLHNGITVLVLHRAENDKNLTPVFCSVTCDLTDSFSRIVGHNLVVEKATKLLKESEDNIYSFNTCGNFYRQPSLGEEVDNPNGVLAKDVYRRIANKLVCDLKRKQKQKTEEVVELLPTSKELELTLKTGSTLKVDKVVYKHFSLPTRYSQFRKLHNRIFESSGVTLATMFLSDGTQITSGSICSKADNFCKETGRQLALLNFVNGKSAKVLKQIKRLNHRGILEFMTEKNI